MQESDASYSDADKEEDKSSSLTGLQSKVEVSCCFMCHTWLLLLCAVVILSDTNNFCGFLLLPTILLQSPLYPPPLSSPLQVPGRGDRRSSAGGRTRSANSSLILRAVADAHRSVTSSKRTSAHLQQEEHSSSSSKGKKPKVGVTRDT